MSKPAPTKRPTSTAPEIPKPPCTIHPSAVIADKAQLTGSHAVHIGEHSVLHPHARVRADDGAVRIGRNVSVGEMAVVGGGGGGEGEGDTDVGDGTEIGPGAVVEGGVRIGAGTVVEGKARVGRGAVVGRFCRVTALGEVRDGEEVGDFTVVFGDGRRRWNRTLAENEEVREAREKGQEMQVQLLKRLIPDASAKWG